MSTAASVTKAKKATFAAMIVTAVKDLDERKGALSQFPGPYWKLSQFQGPSAKIVNVKTGPVFMGHTTSTLL